MCPGRAWRFRCLGKAGYAHKIAVVVPPATREMLSVLAELLSDRRNRGAGLSTRSVGTEVLLGDSTLKVKALDYFDFGTDISA